MATTIFPPLKKLPTCRSLPAVPPTTLVLLVKQLALHAQSVIRQIVACGPGAYASTNYHVRVNSRGAITCQQDRHPVRSVQPPGTDDILVIQRFYAHADAVPGASFYRVVPDEAGNLVGDLVEMARTPGSFRYQMRQPDDDPEDPKGPPFPMWEFFHMEPLSPTEALRYVMSPSYLLMKEGEILAWLLCGCYPPALDSLRIPELRTYREALSDADVARIGGDRAFATAAQKRLAELVAQRKR